MFVSVCVCPLLLGPSIRYVTLMFCKRLENLDGDFEREFSETAVTPRLTQIRQRTVEVKNNS